MSLPLPFLLGVAVLLLHDQLRELLPRTVAPQECLPWLVLVPLPGLLLAWVGRALIHARQQGRQASALALVARLLPLAVPGAFSLLVLPGELPRCAAALVGDSSAGFLLVTLTPLLAAELIFRGAERRLDHMPGAGLAELPMAPPGHLPTILLIAVPLIVLAAVSDAVRAVPWLDAFVAVTSLGNVLSIGGAVGVLGVALPLLFRGLMPVTRELPARVAADLRATAQALGFPADALLYMRTGHRLPNAALVGPLRWPRYLVLTDALVALLDTFALRGVVAHEVGHARAGHGALLLAVFVGIPLLLLHPSSMWFAGLGSAEVVAMSAVVLVVCVLLMRQLAHRFEHEADQISAAALGGAGPCIDALSRVSDLSAHSARRGSLRHPSDRVRIAKLLRWEVDPAARARFLRRGRALRAGIGIAVAGAGVACGVAQVQAWPLDRAAYAFQLGDFPTAQARLDALGPSPHPALREQAERLRGFVRAARTLVPEGGAWPAIEDRVAEGAWPRMLELVRAGDAEAAEPWAALAVVGRDPEPWRETVRLMVGAAAQGDAARLERLRAHLLTLDAPEAATAAVASLRPAER